MFIVQFSGHHTILIPPSEVEANPALWLTAVSQYKVRDTFCSYGELISPRHLGFLRAVSQYLLYKVRDTFCSYDELITGGIGAFCALSASTKSGTHSAPTVS
jgi:hypothetical protein